MIAEGWTGNSGATTAHPCHEGSSKRGKSSVARAMAAAGIAAASVLILLGQSQNARAEELKGDIEAAKDKISMCTGCHSIPGYKASFPRVYHVPMIAGQTRQYIVNALVAYRKGDRSHPTMRSVAGSLSDQDIADLAAFYSQPN